MAVARRQSLNGARKENGMVTTFAMNTYVDVHVSRLSRLWEESPDYFRMMYKGETKAEKLQLFSTLSLYFRNDGNTAASQKFLQYALSLSRDLFDDYNSPSTFNSGFGFALLSYALAIDSPEKGRHFVSFVLFTFFFFLPLLWDSFSDSPPLIVEQNFHGVAGKVAPHWWCQAAADSGHPAGISSEHL